MPRAVLVWAVLLAAPLLAALFAAEESAAPTLGAAPAVVFDERIPWATPRVTGSPEPPLPYRVERVAPHLGFANPTFVVFAPDGDRVFIGEQRGRVFSFSYKSPGEKPDLALDLTTDLTSWSARDGAKRVDALYDLAFDPEFQDNRYIYLTYTLASLTSKPLPNGTRVSRFKLTDEQPPRIDPASEKIIITWVEGGHNGGCLEFGRDGYLYVSTGDAATPNPPDVLATGQDCRDLLSSILRID
ncbi:MAG TPA: PQQ-dependent sugar dehydrogenase, partial [Pirellulales bacterium]